MFWKRYAVENDNEGRCSVDQLRPVQAGGILRMCLMVLWDSARRPTQAKKDEGGLHKGDKGYELPKEEADKASFQP
jgi:hypothetical protein